MDNGSRNQYLEGRNVTILGLVTNLALIGAKMWGGVLAQSQALIADGIHSVSDLVSDGVVLWGLKWGRRSADESHPFGHGRLETLAALFVGVSLAAAGFAMGWSAARDIYFGRTGNPAFLAAIVAGISILSKEALYRYTRLVGKRINSTALISNAWHHRSDALSSVAVLIGVVGAQLNPRWGVLDSCAAIVVSALIVQVGATFVFAALKELVDTAPEKRVVDQIENCAYRVNGVLDVHDLRTRTSGGKVFAEIHIMVNGDMTVREGHAVAKAVERCLFDEVPRLDQAIVHVDPTDLEEQA
jgi:cation diffusion facilitator family transporter